MSTERYDVVVIGSGGAGLVAACVASDRGARVLVLEATNLLGGTTALSGGQLWIPNTAAMARAGYPDSAVDALTYLRRVTMGTGTEDHLTAFLEAGPRLADYLENDLGIPLQAIARDDYHPDWAGARFGRSLEPLPVPTTGVGELRARLRISPTRGPLTSTESRSGLSADALRIRQQEDIRTQGAGLIAGLVAAAADRSVTLTTGRRVVQLHRGTAGFTVVAETSNGGHVEITSRAVVLACGGFAANEALRHDFLPAASLVSTTAAGSLGDAIPLGLSNGAHLAGMSEAWWTPATAVPAIETDGHPLHRNLVRELAYPGSILVNAAGHRFVNEASSYNDLGKAFLRFDADNHRYPNAKAWMIFDAGFKKRYPVAGVTPDAPAPGWFTTAPDLITLATRLGIDPAGLSHTVAAMDDYAATGVDREFGRGANSHDAFNGDARHAPNPCLGALGTAPFHAVEVSLGLNGTKGGLVTDAAGAVLGHDNLPVAGLFACGEAAAALMGPGYAGSGASLGPALTAGMTIGETIPLQRTASPPDSSALLAPSHPERKPRVIN
jgi:succinate dehydrogenase/fumarate reductase flavoprotein subunit